MSTYQFNTLFQVNVMCIHFMYLTVRFRWKADVKNIKKHACLVKKRGGGMKGIMVMMKSKILTILILSLLYISTSAAPTDVNGWGKIEWDMSLSEVKSIFPDRNVTKGFDNSTGSGQFIVDEYRLYGELFQTRTFWWQSELINIHVSLKNFNLRNENLSELAKKDSCIIKI